MIDQATMHGLAREHDVSRDLVRLWVRKFETGEFDEERAAVDMLSQFKARIAELERKVDRLTMENDLLKKTSRTLRRASVAQPSIVSGPKPSPSAEDAS
jgi:transposase-like protein